MLESAANKCWCHLLKSSESSAAVPTSVISCCEFNRFNCIDSALGYFSTCTEISDNFVIYRAKLCASIKCKCFYTVAENGKCVSMLIADCMATWQAIPDSGMVNGETAVLTTCRCPSNYDLASVDRSQMTMASIR